MMKRQYFAAFVVLVFFSVVGFAQTASDDFERGNVLYREGKFEQAAAAYEAILGQGLAGPAVYFNLGNSYYRLGKIAPAILAYERSLRLQPNDPDVKHNLSLVNLKTSDRIEPLPDLFFVEWLRAFSVVVPLRTTGWLFAVAWVLFFGGLAALYILGSSAAARFARILAVGAFVALIPLTALIISQVADSRSRNDAIITAAVVTAKTSPDVQSVDAFVIHEGLKVRLSDSVGGWVKIVLADGKVGWVRAADCERI
jgi:tetratricopeptide (TPR) repeat protein